MRPYKNRDTITRSARSGMTSHLVELVLFVLFLFLLLALLARLVAVGQTDHRQPLGVRFGVTDAALVAVHHIAVTRRQLQQQQLLMKTDCMLMWGSERHIRWGRELAYTIS